MDYLTFFQHMLRDFILTVKNYRTVFPFIKKNKLWEGMFSYSWAAKFLLLVGILVSIKFSNLFDDWYNQVATQGISFSAVGSLVQNTFSEGYDLFVSSGFKYAILILLEVVIFHFARQTLQVLTGEEAEDSLKAFITAQIRMIKVVAFSYGMEMVLSILAGVFLSLLGLDILKDVIVFGIQCFFLGFVIVDNYNEIYGMKIKQSFKYARQYAGVSFGIGVVVYVLMLIPVLGAALAPLLGAVTATITMHELNKKDRMLEMALVDNSF